MKDKYYLENPLHANINSDFTGKRVLLVEDNSLNIEIAKEILEMSNLEVDVAINGLEALNLMKDIKDGYYDLIFMDIQMPIMNGLEATTAIRAIGREYTSNVPIVAMTANAFADDVVATRKAGMNEHLPKPINFEQLVEVLNRFIK
jgi:CheY-like chemotaxis protein